MPAFPNGTPVSVGNVASALTGAAGCAIFVANVFCKIPGDDWHSATSSVGIVAYCLFTREESGGLARAGSVTSICS